MEGKGKGEVHRDRAESGGPNQAQTAPHEGEVGERREGERWRGRRKREQDETRRAGEGDQEKRLRKQRVVRTEERVRGERKGGEEKEGVRGGEGR